MLNRLTSWTPALAMRSLDTSRMNSVVVPEASTLAQTL
jgi:hypothetical protein